jgi:hypothetical protein
MGLDTLIGNSRKVKKGSSLCYFVDASIVKQQHSMYMYVVLHTNINPEGHMMDSAAALI